MPEQTPGVDGAQSLAEGYARACLADLLKAGGGTRPGLAVLAEGGWAVFLSVFPAPAPAAPGGPALSDCERDCLLLLSQAQDNLPAARVRDELESRGIGIYAEITVKRALANLHKRLKLVCNSSKRPRGYWLPEASPPCCATATPPEPPQRYAD